MHIADGILPTGWSIAGHGLAWASVWALGRNTEPREVVRMGFLATTTFVISLVHFPLGGTSVHLGLFGLTGILLGARAFPVIFASLLFQALLFQHGGLLTLGINSINMGVGGLIGAAVWSVQRVPARLRAFSAGLLGAFVPALLLAAEFALAEYGKGFFFLASLYVAVALIEGLVTIGIIEFLQRTKPAILARAAA
jgi:cobalt/nickel transport system permease protein